MPKQKNSSLDFEVQVITSFIQAINYSMPDAQKTATTAEAEQTLLKALFYEVKEGTNEKNFIIVDSFLLKDGDELRLSTPEEEYLITLKDKKNVGLGYWQFECKRVAEVIPEPLKAIVQQKKGYDFI